MEKNENMVRIQRLSMRLGLVFNLGIYVLPVLTILYWLNYNAMPLFMRNDIGYVEAAADLLLNSRCLALLGSVPLVVVAVRALINLRQLFFLYETGVYFQGENVRRFRMLGRLAFWEIAADMVYKSVLSVALTLNNPPGERLLSITFSSDYVKLLVVAIIINLIGMVMDEARKNHDELEMTV